MSELPKIIGVALRLGALGLPLPPKAEAKVGGRLYSKNRDAAAISHHYDVGNEFYALFPGETMTYSCAYFETVDITIDEAQTAKHDLICRKLGLEAGMRLLDTGCGWGGMAGAGAAAAAAPAGGGGALRHPIHPPPRSSPIWSRVAAPRRS